MLLGDLRKRTLSIGKIQFTLAIIIGNKLGSALEEAILNVDTDTLKSYVENTRVRKGSRYTDEVRAVIECLFTQQVLQHGKRKCSFLEYCARGKGTPYVHVTAEELWLESMRTFRDYSDKGCFLLFTDTPYAREKVLMAIRRYYKDITRDLDPTPAKLNAIFNDFKERQINSYSSGFIFASNHDNPIGWLIKALEFFSRDKTYYTDRVNERNQDQLIGGDGGTTQLELAAMESKPEVQEIDFPAVVSDIALASNLLYVHRNKEKAYSDIYTHYVNRKIEQTRVDIVRSLRSDACVYSVVNAWDPVITDASHINNKKNSRDNIASAMEVLVDSPIAVPEVAKLYKNVLAVNESIPLNREGTIKDGMRLFDAKNISVRSKMRNGERFEILYKGYVSLGKLVRYLNGKGIPLPSIPTDIFRNIRLPRRFYSLEEYLKLGDKVNKLIQDVEGDEERSKQVVDGMWSNDAIFDTISLQFSKEAANVQNFLRNSCTLSDIKKAISFTENKREQMKVDEHACALYYKYKDEMSLLLLGSVYNKRTKVPAIQLFEGDKDMEEFARKAAVIVANNSAEYLAQKFLIYPGKANYLEYLDPNGLTQVTPEYRKNFVTCYQSSLSWAERYAIIAGCFADCQLSGLRYLHYCFMLAFYNFDNFRNLTANKERVRRKLCRSYVHLLETIMEKEGHPVKENHLYALRGATIEEEFSYLYEGCRAENDQKSVMVAINQRKFCIDKCAECLLANQPDGDWNKLRDLFITVSVYEKTWLRVIDALATISNLKREMLTENELRRRMNTQAEYNKFVYDGSFGALARASAYSSLCKIGSPVTSVTDIPYLWDIDMYSVQNGSVPYENPEDHGVAVVVDTMNCFIKQHPDISEFFRNLEEQLTTRIRYGLEVDVANVSDGALEKVLKKAANTIYETYDITSRFGKEYTGKIRRMLHTANCDPDGYLMLFSRRYSAGTSEGRNYIHNSGFWVCVHGNDYELKPLEMKDYDNLREIIK